MKIIASIFFIILSLGLFAQDTLMFQETEGLYSKAKFGANRKHFVHFYSGIGFFLPGSDQEKIKYWNSHSLILGLRYKYKLTGTFATGFDIYYKKDNFRFTQTNDILPEENFFDKERFIVHGMGPEYYFRINFDNNRGDYVGNFIDIGLYANWLFHDTYKVYDNSDSQLFSKCKKTYKNHSHLNKFNYGLTLRMAKNAYVLFVHHRLSDYFDDHYGYIDLPATTVGVIIGFHN